MPAEASPMKYTVRLRTTAAFSWHLYSLQDSWDDYGCFHSNLHFHALNSTKREPESDGP